MNSVEYLHKIENDVIDRIGGDKKWRPLMYAANNGHFNVVEFLLNNGVDINSDSNDNGCNALILGNIYLIRHQNFVISILLITKAAKNGHYKIVECLIQNGSVINLASNFGYTALMGGNQILIKINT